MTLLALVENAVRHGIDPSEEGGRIEVDVSLHTNRCNVRVIDTRVGLQAAGVDSVPVLRLCASVWVWHSTATRASIGETLRMIAIEQIDFLQSDERYTRVGWRADDGRPSEALVITRGFNDAADTHLRGRSEVLPVSRRYLHLFRQT